MKKSRKTQKLQNPVGTLEVFDLGSENILDSVTKQIDSVHLSQYVWRSSAELNLDPGFELSLDCRTGKDGTRQFFPSDPDRFPHYASLAGHAIREHLGLIPLDGELRIYQMLYQKARKRRESLKKAFTQVSDLTPPRRGHDKSANTLPDHLGLANNGTGTRWTIGQLMSHGREAAERSGKEQCDQETCIRLGLLEAARLNPLPMERLTELEARAFLRRGLFDLGPVPNSDISTEEHDLVVKRLKVAIAQHLEDSTGEFGDWFGNMDNLVRRISKKKGKEGTIAREHVRQVLVEEIFSAHLYVAANADSLMRQFVRLLPAPLSTHELAIFSATFLQQSRLGGFSLFMLRDRVSSLKEIGDELLRNPLDDQLVGVMLRMLEFYADMSNKRRAFDVDYKKQRKHEKKVKRKTSEVKIPASQASQRPEAGIVDELNDYLREKYDVKCGCGSGADWKCKVEKSRETKSTNWKYVCKSCGHRECLVVSDDELRKRHEELWTDEKTNNFGSRSRKLQK